MITQDTRYCEICCRDEKCHCPAMKSWCSVCVPPISVAARNTLSSFVAQLPAQSRYAQEQGEPAPRPVRIPLVSRMMA